MRVSLLFKFLAINIAVITVTVFSVWMAIDYIAADYYADLMRRYKIMPSVSHRMFLDAAHRSLIQATFLALGLAGTLSFVLNRRVLRPLAAMTEATQQVAAGNYQINLSNKSSDEFDELAAAFSQMAKSLQDLESFRTKTMIDVAHGLRTPLTNMRGYLEALSNNVLPPSKETFELLHEETMRLVKLVESLVRLARADTAVVSIRKRKLHLGELIEQIYELFQLKFAAKGINVITELSAAGQVAADGEMISQVLSNLLDNACRYTPEGGSCRIEAEKTANRVKIWISNTGAGIAAGDTPFIFQRFYRGNNARVGDSGSAGVGLTIVEELVKAHGGEVGMTRKDELTMFWFALPL